MCMARQRLARAHRTLSDARYAACTIAAIALEAGFGDVSTFNPLSPGLWRLAIRRAGGGRHHDHG